MIYNAICPYIHSTLFVFNRVFDTLKFFLLIHYDGTEETKEKLND